VCIYIECASMQPYILHIIKNHYFSYLTFCLKREEQPLCWLERKSQEAKLNFYSSDLLLWLHIIENKNPN
jgi:hypothetical protein